MCEKFWWWLELRGAPEVQKSKKGIFSPTLTSWRPWFVLTFFKNFNAPFPPVPWPHVSGISVPNLLMIYLTLLNWFPGESEKVYDFLFSARIRFVWRHQVTPHKSIRIENFLLEERHNLDKVKKSVPDFQKNIQWKVSKKRSSSNSFCASRN